MKGDAQASSPVVAVAGVSKLFQRADGTSIHALQDVALDLMPGEFVVLLGPSGCGKTTLLNAIVGLERPDSGRISIGGRPVFSAAEGIDVKPEHRRLSMVFQSYALWPHMTVRDNVAFPLECQIGLDRREIDRRVEAILAKVGIPELRDQHPAQMSGGQQQRVALARALVAGTDLVLFDEPLSNVDAKVREQLRVELMVMQREIGFAALFVTHDQQEAMMLAHRIVVMEQGRVAQTGSPEEIYNSPASRYVANFIGTSNELPGRVAAIEPGGEVRVDTPLGSIAVLPGMRKFRPGDEVVLLWRPERSRLSPDAPSQAAWPVTMATSVHLGTHNEHTVRSGDLSFRIWTPDRQRLAFGTRMWLEVHPSDFQIFHA